MKTYFNTRVTLTRLQIGGSKKAYGKAGNVQNDLKKISLWPVIPDIFSDYTFAPADIRDIELASNNQTIPNEDEDISSAVVDSAVNHLITP